MIQINFSKGFTRRLKKLTKRSNYHVIKTNLHDVMEYSATSKPVLAKYKNHKLNDSSKYKDCWECHLIDIVLVLAN